MSRISMSIKVYLLLNVSQILTFQSLLQRLSNQILVQVLDHHALMCQIFTWPIFYW